MITKLMVSVKRVFHELNQVCHDISRLSSEIDENNCIEKYRSDIEMCEAEMDHYFES